MVPKLPAGDRWPGAWQRTVLYPRLPGDDLEVHELEQGTALYDPDTRAYLVGNAVEIGTDEAVSTRPR